MNLMERRIKDVWSFAAMVTIFSIACPALAQEGSKSLPPSFLSDADPCSEILESGIGRSNEVSLSLPDVSTSFGLPFSEWPWEAKLRWIFPEIARSQNRLFSVLRLGAKRAFRPDLQFPSMPIKNCGESCRVNVDIDNRYVKLEARIKKTQGLLNVEIETLILRDGGIQLFMGRVPRSLNTTFVSLWVHLFEALIQAIESKNDVTSVTLKIPIVANVRLKRLLRELGFSSQYDRTGDPGLDVGYTLTLPVRQIPSPVR